jgi:hypothetical protein
LQKKSKKDKNKNEESAIEQNSNIQQHIFELEQYRDSLQTNIDKKLQRKRTEFNDKALLYNIE